MLLYVITVAAVVLVVGPIVGAVAWSWAGVIRYRFKHGRLPPSSTAWASGFDDAYDGPPDPRAWWAVIVGSLALVGLFAIAAQLGNIIP